METKKVDMSEDKLVKQLNSLIRSWEGAESYARTASDVLDDEMYVIQAETLLVCVVELRHILENL
jgi:hypothetical protein